MRGALAIFTKTPELSPVKTRLARDVGADAALNFFSWCIRQVGKTAEQAADYKGNIDVFWAIAEKEGLNHERWTSSPFKRIWSGEGCFGTQMHHVSNQLIEEGYDYVIITGTDIPDLTPSLIKEAADYLEQNPGSCVVGPTEDGSAYLYGSNMKTAQKPWVQNDYQAFGSWKDLTSKLGFENIMVLPMLTGIKESGDLEKIKGAI